MPPSLVRLLNPHHSPCNTCPERGCFEPAFLYRSRTWTISWCLPPAERTHSRSNTLSVAASSSAFCAHHQFFYSCTDVTSSSLHFTCTGTATFSSGTFPLPQLSPRLLWALRAAAQVLTLSALTFLCFRAAQEIQCLSFLPFCSSNELCDATQLLIFSGIVAEVH